MKIFKNKTVIVSLFCIVIACVLLISAQAQSATPDEAVNSEIYTDSILEKADIELGEYDKVIRTDSEGCVSISVVRAFPVEVDYCGERFTAYCTGGTVEDALKSLGFTLTGLEEVTPTPDTLVSENTKIVVQGDSRIILTLDGEVSEHQVKGGTVEDFLKSIGVTLSKDDEVTPSLSTVINKDMDITVVRVEYKEETTTEVVDYDFVTENTSSLVSGTSKIKQYGIEGEKTITSKNKYVDGVLVESEVIKEEITKEPVDQIKLVGTGKAPTQSNTTSKPKPNNKPNNNNNSGGVSADDAAGYFYDSNGKKVYYKKKLTGSSTAYYASPGALTATGVPVYQGGVAVNPNVIPYGSKLYIVSADGSYTYGYATAVDTGGALMSGYVLVDVFYPTYNQCISWGRRTATVYVIS